MQVFADMWNQRYPGTTPNLGMQDEFIGVLRDGIIELVHRENNDPVAIFKKTVENLISTLTSELETALTNAQGVDAKNEVF